MRNKDLLKRIEELEKKVSRLESNEVKPYIGVSGNLGFDNRQIITATGNNNCCAKCGVAWNIHGTACGSFASFTTQIKNPHDILDGYIISKC